MKEITKSELAAIKRVATTTAPLRSKVEKIEEKINKLMAEKHTYMQAIDSFEAGIISLTGFQSNDLVVKCDDKIGYQVTELLQYNEETKKYNLVQCAEDFNEVEEV